jgi:hypothetical protein
VSIVNRRNALLGWAVWTMVRQQAKRRAKRAVSVEASPGSWRGRLVALAVGVATAIGLVFVWRKVRGEGDDRQAPVEAPTVDGAEPTPLGALRDDDVPPAA